MLLITPEQYSFISEYSLLEQLGRHERTPFDVSPFRAFVMNATVCTAPTAKTADQGRQGYFDENGH